ncbi:hypothetical protein NDU88_000565 [Pleurodeles waltl]|uniref:Uncharacterized protein n=1 Tax=Pleurodeles waltl TaxID=8319 RepID=A0AAV7US30_PLEWA|nr:hypothetical protein NDU88_000565 [Pleurodeles waltl]
MGKRSEAPKAIRMAPEGAPSPQGLALYVITEEIIVSLPALTHTGREGMIKSAERRPWRAPRPGAERQDREPARAEERDTRGPRPPPQPQTPGRTCPGVIQGHRVVACSLRGVSRKHLPSSFHSGFSGKER